MVQDIGGIYVAGKNAGYTTGYKAGLLAMAAWCLRPGNLSAIREHTDAQIRLVIEDIKRTGALPKE